MGGKRLVDLLASMAGLLVLSPFFLAIAVAIRLTSPGPVFYRHSRVGRSGRVFGMLKFRSMVADADKIGPGWTDFDDPRITRVGRFLRRSSLDELPQLFNVLRGDMSLIGPRPEQPERKGDFSEAAWELRHRVRPGITGLAQVSGRHFISAERRNALDARYAGSADAVLDLRIVVLTVREMVLGDRIWDARYLRRS